MIMGRKKEVSPQYRRKVRMEATILEVVSPCHFIVRETPNASMSLEARQFLAMETRLNKYYSSREVVYCSVPEKDVVVVILPEGEEKWYRARVVYALETTRGPSVNCYLLDYGGRRMVSRERMYQISEDFLSVPFQAIDFILLGIKPMTMNMDRVLNISYGPAEEWDCASMEYVKGLCASMEAAFMEILGFDSDGCIYGNLHIEDGKNRFCLNEVLVAEKYAIVSMDDCESIQKCVSIEVNNDVEEVRSPVPNVSVPVPESYTLKSYLAGLFDDNGDLTRKDLVSLRSSLENQEGGDEVQSLDVTNESSSEARPKVCLSKQYLNMKAALMQSRPCSRVEPKKINTSPNESTDVENASASNFKTHPPLSISLQSKVRSLYRSKFTSSQSSTAMCPKLCGSSLSPEEKGKLSDISFSSCSVPYFSSDDESVYRQPSTPFPVEEDRLQHGQTNSETLFIKNSVVTSRQNINDKQISCSSNELCKRSLPVNVSHSSVNSIGKYPVHAVSYQKSEALSGSLGSQKVSSSSVSSTDSTCDTTPKYPCIEGYNSDVSPEKHIENFTASSPTSPVCVSSNVPTKCSPKNVDYSSLRKKLLRVPKSCVSSSSSVSKESPPTFDKNSQQYVCSSDSLKRSADSSSYSSEKLLHDQVSMLPARNSSKATDYKSLHEKLLRLQKGRFSSNTSLPNGPSTLLETSLQCESECSSSEKCKNSFSNPCENKSLPATVLLSSSSLSSDSTTSVQEPQPLNIAAQSGVLDMKALDSECGDSWEKQFSQKILPNPSDGVILQTHVSSVAPREVSPRTQVQVPSNYGKLPSKELLPRTHKKCDSTAKIVSVDEKLCATQKEVLLDSKQDGFSHADEKLLSNEQVKLLLPTMSESSSNEVSNEHCLQNEPLSWQSNGKRVSIGELFASCKEQGETLTSVSTRTCYTTSNKILEHVRRAFKKGNLYSINQNSQHESTLKNSPAASVVDESITLADISDSVPKPPQPENFRRMELNDLQGHAADNELPFGVDHDNGTCINKVGKKLDSDSSHVVISDIPPQLENAALQDSHVQTENTKYVNKKQELLENYDRKATNNSREETSLNSKGEEKSSSQFSGNGDVCALKDDTSGVSEDSSGDEGIAMYGSMSYSVVQSLTQQMIDSSNSICQQYFKTELDFTDKSLWEMTSIPALSIGNCIPPPLLRTEEVPFTDQIRKRLEELHFWGPSCIQSVVWPAVFRNRSFAAVAPPASGKSIAYLLPLLSMLIDGTKYKDVPVSHGAVILILCSTWFKVVKLHDQCMNLLEGTNKVKIKVLYGGGGDKDQEVSLCNGCDILISTPSSLLYYLQKKATNFDRCCNIVLDDGAQLIEHCKEEITSIMQELLVHIKRIKQPTTTLQIGICSEKWTKGVASFAEKFLLVPLFFFTSFVEAAIYSQIPMYIHSCTIQTIDFVLLGLLDGIICPKVVVCTKDIETAKHVHGVLQTNAVFSMLAHDNKPQYELTAIKRHWNLHRRHDSTFILVITDSALLNMNIRDADCTVHYDLPEISKLSFSQRFGCFGDYFYAKFQDDPNQQKHVCHILITEECKVQAPTLVKLMNRMGREYPKQLLQFACEQKKLSSNRLEGPLCEYMKAFGVCKDSRCVRRHVIVKEMDAPTIVPKQGDIKAAVIEVIDASHYYIKILEYTDPVTLSTTVVSAQYTKMFMDLKNYYSQASNKTVTGTVKSGEMFGIEESPSVFHRVRVLDIIPLSPTPNDCKTQKVKVFFLDDGWIKEKETSELLVLPEEFQSRPQMCVEAYLSNIKTVDSCNRWTPQANTFVSKVITGKEIHATIALCLGDVIWLDPLVLKEGRSVNVLKLDRTLKRLGLALPNMDHLQNLYGACTDKIDLPVMSHLKKKEKAKPLQTVSYAFLDLGLCEDVYLPEVMSPQQFFVQRCKFYDQLNILEKEISDLHKKEELKKCQSVWEGMYCIASFPDDGKLYRAQVESFKDAEGTEVDVFFADYGDCGTAHRSNLYVIPPKLLLLPFQAVECELAGISAPQEKWPAEAGDMLFDLTRYENDDLKTLTAKVFQKTSSVTGGSIYTIQLFDGSINISEQLVKSGLAVAAELPELPPLLTDESDKQPDVDLDDIPLGYVSGSSDNSMDLADTEASLLFCAALCGLYTPRVNVCPAKTDKAYPPATVEEVVESTTSSNCDIIKNDASPPQSPTTNHLDSSPKSNSCTNLKPSITWWDIPGEVFITIKLLGIQTYDLHPLIDGFSFSTNLGDKHYFVEVTFFAEVIPEKTVVDCKGQCVQISFTKKEFKKWPHLTKQAEKVFYIQRDLDHIDTESECEKSESPDIFMPRSPVKKEDVRHVCSTSEEEASSSESDYDSSWKKLCQPKEM